MASIIAAVAEALEQVVKTLPSLRHLHMRTCLHRLDSVLSSLPPTLELLKYEHHEHGAAFVEVPCPDVLDWVKQPSRSHALKRLEIDDCECPVEDSEPGDDLFQIVLELWGLCFAPMLIAAMGEDDDDEEQL